MAPRKKSDRVTIKTVAEDSGVSVAAVSKVLRDAYGVSAELRSRVQASMQKLAYRPHAAARGMRGQSYTIGVLLPDLRNPFFGDLMAGINSALERTQYQPLIGVGQSATSIEQALVDAMFDRQMDGLILVGPRMLSRDMIAVAERSPTVLIGHHPPPDKVNFDTVNNDDRLGAQLVVLHLVEMGYRDIAFLNQALPDAEGTLVTTQRELGFLAAMAEAGLSTHASVIRSLQTPRETQLATRHALQSRHPPKAIFCWTDFIALEVLSVARELGLRVPEDVAVVGYDNTSYCDLAQNALTSIDQSGQVLGLQAARLLIERIKGRETPEHLTVTPRLVARASSRRVGAAERHG
jgi:DNA-binding LacI/PurR family transcriptional regulator